MSHEDPLATFEGALFRAARSERTRSNALARTTSAVVAAHRRRRSRRSLLALGATVALAAGAMLLLRESRSAESIQAEHLAPKHAVPSVAAPSQVERIDPAAEPTLPVSDDAGALRTGLAPSVSATTLEEEVVMLKRARAELDAGKAKSALSLLDQYDRVAGGHLTAEAALLRIQVLAQSGQGALAAKLARRLVDSDPTGPVAKRARVYILEP